MSARFMFLALLCFVSIAHAAKPTLPSKKSATAADKSSTVSVKSAAPDVKSPASAALAAATPVPTPTPAPAGPSLTLEQSINMAVENSTTSLKSLRDREFSGTQLLQGYMQFLPNLAAQGTYNKLSGTTFLTQSVPTLVNGNSYGAGYQISTALNLFNGFGDIAALRAAHDRRTAADQSYVRVREQIALDISQSFLQVILDQKLVQIAEKNLKASLERQRLLEEQSKVGIRTLSDLFRQQAQTSSDESYLISSQNKRETDLIVLLRKLRIDPNQPYNLIEPPLEDQIKDASARDQKLDEKVLTDTALEQRRDFKVSQHLTSAFKRDVTTARSAYWPKLDFVASYNTLSRHFDHQDVNGVDQTPATQLALDDQLRDRGSYNYGIVLTWSIFDRWTTSLSVERAKVAAYKAELDTDDFRKQVIGDVHQAIIDFHSAVQQLESSQKGLEAARKSFEVSQGRYEVGSLSFVDLSVAQTALVQAEAARAQALVGYDLRRRAVEYAVGTPISGAESSIQ